LEAGEEGFAGVIGISFSPGFSTLAIVPAASSGLEEELLLTLAGPPSFAIRLARI